MTPTPHYPAGRATPADRHAHPPGAVEIGEHGETVLRSGYLRNRGDIATRSLDHAAAAADGARRARRHFRRGDRPDVVVATSPAIESLLAGRFLSRLWSVPLVAEMRDAWPDLVTHMESPTGHSGARLGRAGRLAKAAVHTRITQWQRGADAIVTTTERFADVLRGRGLGSVHVIRNGADLPRIEAPPAHAPDHHPELRCVYLGNLGRSQGLDMVVRAAARLQDQGVRVNVRMMGHGAYAADLAALAARLHAPVRVSTRIPHSLVRHEYAWSDTVLVSLRDWAPFDWTVPSKLYEVMATGRHVTGVLRGEAADVLRAAGAGEVVTPGDEDALVQLWSALAADRSRLGAFGGGRDWVAREADDNVLAARYLQIIHRVLGAGRPGQATAP